MRDGKLTQNPAEHVALTNLKKRLPKDILTRAEVAAILDTSISPVRSGFVTAPSSS